MYKPSTVAAVPDVHATASSGPGLDVNKKAMTAGMTRKAKTTNTPAMATDDVTTIPKSA